MAEKMSNASMAARLTQLEKKNEELANRLFDLTTRVASCLVWKNLDSVNDGLADLCNEMEDLRGRVSWLETQEVDDISDDSSDSIVASEDTEESVATLGAAGNDGGEADSTSGSDFVPIIHEMHDMPEESPVRLSKVIKKDYKPVAAAATSPIPVGQKPANARVRLLSAAKPADDLSEIKAFLSTNTAVTARKKAASTPSAKAVASESKKPAAAGKKRKTKE